MSSSKPSSGRRVAPCCGGRVCGNVMLAARRGPANPAGQAGGRAELVVQDAVQVRLGEPAGARA
eukprot:5638595-Lingulodinium_polyedra.AAC.1